ncbi:MAG: LacI family transcriptional regulator [Propionibacteriaceae bacterium]|jgi:LacI family transcriptional regulator|nr:LacI family transcriptional regulator [Propionibacteriaceae bacterium]
MQLVVEKQQYQILRSTRREYTSMSTSKRVTIKDVAAAAGMSIATVSNVINHPQVVKPETLERVKGCIERLGFIPDTAARQLRLGRSLAVGAVMRDLGNPYAAETIRGMDDSLRDAMWMLMVSGSHGEAARQAHYIDFYERQRVSALVVRPAGTDFSSLEAAGAGGRNIVLLDTIESSAVLSSVGIDHAAGAALAITSLLEKGYRNILYVEDDLTCEATAKVTAGVSKAVQDAGLNFNQIITKVGSQSATFAEGHKLVADQLASGTKIDAIFAGDEFLAYGAYRALVNGGVAPADADVIGYGDAKTGNPQSLPVSLVHLPMYELGQKAAELAVNPSEEPQRIELVPSLKH